jgi:hypothetical protein
MEELLGFKLKSQDELANLAPTDFIRVLNRDEAWAIAIGLVIAVVGIGIVSGACETPPKTPIEKLTERLDRLERGLRNLGSPVKEADESKRSNYRVRARVVSDEDDDDKDD